MSLVLDPCIWVVLPAFNEKKYISKVIANLKTYTSNIIVVDDGSNDGTNQEAAKSCKYTLSHHINLGKGAALLTGCEYAFNFKKAKYVILMDADDQHSSEEIFLFEKELFQGNKLILGTRSLWEMPILRSIGNRMVSAMVVILFGRYIPDILSGYKAFSKSTYEKIKWKSQKYGVELEIATHIARKKIKFKTVPISTIYHDFDRGMNVLDTIELLLQIIMLRLNI